MRLGASEGGERINVWLGAAAKNKLLAISSAKQSYHARKQVQAEPHVLRLHRSQTHKPLLQLLL